MAKKLAIGCIMLLLTLGASVVSAEAVCSSYPYTLTNGATADATQVMANFNCAALTSGATLLNVTQLGIGTTSSSYPLQVNGSALLEFLNGTTNVAYTTSSYAAIDTLWIGNASTTAGAGAGISFAPKGAGSGGIASIGAISTATDYSTAMVFQTRSSGGTDAEQMRITATGNVGIGTTAPGYLLYVNGSAAGPSGFQTVSDARLKKNIAPLNGGLALISELQPVRFDFRSESEREVGKELKLPANRQIGFIAQDVAKILPEATTTSTSKGAIMSVAEAKVVPVLVAAVKELKAANDNQAMEIAQLKASVVSLQRKLGIQTASK
ncbi:MAG TPA: tail fiber domain-containing protein [Rhizomicrobium sp.]|nr:tail fiber domain-containing protein [Rhizomicrobium sp.]